MSSNEEDYPQEFHQGKTRKRRVHRACDRCRRRKSDGYQMPGADCTICSEAMLECTYLGSAAKRSPSQTQSYIDSLERRLAESEALVRQLQSQLDTLRASSSFLNLSTDGGKNNVGPVSPTERTTLSLFLMRTTLRDILVPQPSHGDDLVHLDLAQRIQKLHVGQSPGRRFVGKSSAVLLLNVALNLKEDMKREEALGHGHTNDSVEDRSEAPRPWLPNSRLRFGSYKADTAACDPTYTLPSNVRIAELTNLYFTQQNMYMPLLHRPTFERNIADGLHLRHDGFAATVLIVCAIGSRLELDPSVAGPARGWEWFDQVAVIRSQLFGHALLYDLQYYSLAAQFLDASYAPPACWNLVGLGLRAALDIGCHRRTGPVEVPSVERELYKRAFWVLVYQDRVLSSNMGRACAVQYEDFDIDLPIECDDEYWEHPTHPFQQPAGVPSRIAFFNALLRLHHILAFSLKILYGLSKAHVLMHDDGWEEKAVAEFDSALNSWHDQIPEHLRWDPARADPVFFDQSVVLHCAYYHLQVLIHRPFIPMIRKSAPTALPSLAICTSAARAVANIADIQKQRKGSVPFVMNLNTIFISGLILLLNVWSGKRKGLVSDTHPDMANFHKCMDVIRFCQNRWKIAGLLWDILAELTSIGQLPLPNVPSKSGNCEGSQFFDTRATEDTPEAFPGSHQSFARTIDDLQFRMPYESASQRSAFMAHEAWFASDHLAAPIDPTQASNELGDMMEVIDNDTIAMWTNAPMGLEIEDWGSYFSSLSGLTPGQPPHASTGMSSHSEQSYS